MKTTETLNEFVQNVIKYLGSGYKYYKIVQIPHKKRHKSHEIKKKVSEYYKTDLSRGKRQYRRKKQLANYGAVNFREHIIIFRTQGEHNDNKKEFIELEKNLIIEISEHLGIVFFKNEFNRFTVRLDRLTFRRFKQDFYIAIKNANGANYNKLKQMWLNLPKYKGIGNQGSKLHKYIKENLKTFKRDWKALYN